MNFSSANENVLDQIASLLAQAQSVLFVTGAGISAGSGVPTYRGVGGLYNDDTVAAEGFRIEEVLSGSMFQRRPELTWKHLLTIERACRGATFNRGHEVISAFERALDRVWTLTQNVDGFHRLAGSRNVIDIHGDLHTLLCTRCDHRDVVSDYTHLQLPPRCPRCDGIVRPDVVLFDEMLPRHKLEALWRELDRGFDLVFSIGTSSLFPYITEPVLQALDRKIPTVEINPSQTELSGEVAFKLSASATDALDALWSRFAGRSPVAK
jgi:NAD-dependent deacetylase